MYKLGLRRYSAREKKANDIIPIGDKNLPTTWNETFWFVETKQIKSKLLFFD
jgi:hypothetical protein